MFTNYFVPQVGLEPTRISASDFESEKSTNSIIGAWQLSRSIRDSNPVLLSDSQEV